MRLGPTGAPLDALGPVTLPGVHTRAVAAVGGRVLAVSAGTPAPLAGAMIDASASPVADAPFTIAFAPAPNEDQPVVARSGSGYVVAWRSFGGEAVWAARVSNDGDVLPSPVLVHGASAAAGATPYALDLAIGGDGSSVLVTWEGFGGQSGTIAGAQLLSSTLASVGPVIARDILTGPAVAPRVGFDGQKLFGLTTTLGSGLLIPALDSFSVDPSSGSSRPAYLSLPFTGLTGSLYQINVFGETACSATRCLVAYVQSLTSVPSIHGFGPGTIQAVFSGPATQGPFASLTSTADGVQWLHQVAYDGTNWLVVWADNAQTAVHAARVDATGRVLDSPALSIASGQTLRNLSATFDGQQYFVAWGNGGGHVAVARVTPGGTVLDPGGVEGPAGSSPSVTGSLLAYARPSTDGRTQVFVRTLASAAPPPPLVPAAGAHHLVLLAAAMAVVACVRLRRLRRA
jgi:hypothetical protein